MHLSEKPSTGCDSFAAAGLTGKSGVSSFCPGPALRTGRPSRGRPGPRIIAAPFSVSRAREEGPPGPISLTDNCQNSYNTADK